MYPVLIARHVIPALKTTARVPKMELYNRANETCSGLTDRSSCTLSLAELGELDAVAAIRMIISCLSLVGAASVITSAIIKREALNPKIHPIFVLSIADLMLSILYIIGGTLWLRREEKGVPDRVWCFAVTLPTVILQCVTVNLTVLYALLAYSEVKEKHFGNLLVPGGGEGKWVWSPLRTTVSYIIVWILPVVIVMTAFGTIAGQTHVLDKVDKCSCWCKPIIGNVLPWAYGRDEPTIEYRKDMRKIILSNAFIVGTHFLAGFILQVIVYGMIIRLIRRMRKSARGQDSASVANYGATATETKLKLAEFHAKRRMLYFLMAFILSGFFNFLLCYVLSIYDLVQVIKRVGESPTVEEMNHQPVEMKLFYLGLCLQSVTITQQGFLNAIVYGWTREDFLQVMSIKSKQKKPWLHSENNSSESSEAEEEEVVEGPVVKRPSMIREEHSFTHSTHSLAHSSIMDTDYSETDMEDTIEEQSTNRLKTRLTG